MESSLHDGVPSHGIESGSFDRIGGFCTIKRLAGRLEDLGRGIEIEITA